MKNFDEGRMLARILAFPGQIGEGLQRAENLPALPRPFKVWVAGMGGSAIAGDLVVDLWGGRLSTGFEVLRGNAPRPGVGKKDLSVLSSYSGNTEETLGFAKALPHGAKAVAVTSGGALERMAKKKNWPIVALPPGWPPRAALGYALGVMGAILDRCGAVEGAVKDLRKGAEFLKRLHLGDGPKSLRSTGLALAKALRGKVPVAVGVSGETAGTARRFACQLNENSKIPAFWAELPEFGHNLINGFVRGARTPVAPVFFVVSGSKEERRVKACLGVMREAGLKPLVVRDVSGGGVLELIAVGDLASWEFAKASGTDPTPIGPIDRFKHFLSVSH